MIQILIVDDDDRKSSRLSSYLSAVILLEEIHIQRASCVSAAAKILTTTSVDLMILDLNLPLRPDSEPKPDGGMDLLANLLTRKSVRKPTHIIGLTAYADLIDKNFE